MKPIQLITSYLIVIYLVMKQRESFGEKENRFASIANRLFYERDVMNTTRSVIQDTDIALHPE